MIISSSAIKRQRIHVKFMFILRYSSDYLYNIGILDDKYNIYEHTISLRVNSITKHCYKQLNKLFNKYSITKESEIDFLSNIDKASPIYMYLSIINQQIFANIRFVDIDMIPRRIAAYHHTYLGPKKSSEISKYVIEKLWTKLVEMKKCPWITQDIDTRMKNMSIIYRKRMLLIRLGLYYCVIKRFLVTTAIKAREKKHTAVV